MLYQDSEAKHVCLVECVKRNRHKSRFMTYATYKPIWSRDKGWKPTLCHA